MLSTVLAVSTGQPPQYLLERSMKTKLQMKVPPLSGTRESFEKVAEGERIFQAPLIFCHIQSCHGLDNMAGSLWGLHSLKKDTAIYMESL